MKIKLSDLQTKAATRPDGYLSACIAAGTVEGDALRIDPVAYWQLVARFDPDGIESRQMALAVGQGCKGCGE